MLAMRQARALIASVLISTLYPTVMHATQWNERFALDLRAVDIHALIETVSEKTGRNFIIDPRVKATVTVISSGSTNATELYELFLSVLDVHGFAAVTSGEFIKIVPTQVGVQSPLPVLPEQIPATDQSSGEHHSVAHDELATEVIVVQHTVAVELAIALRPLVPETATIDAETNSNTIVVTDSADNIARIVEIVRLLDVPN